MRSLYLSMKTIIFFLLIIGASFVANSCGSASAQDPQTPLVTPAPTGVALLNGQYTYWGEGQYWGPGKDGGSALPVGVPGYIPKVLYDSGTFEADGEGHATQCGAGSWGTWSTQVNCITHWTVKFGFDDSGNAVNPRMGLISSDQGDKATIACTATGKHCVMTSHGVGWSWTQVLDRE
jgi:hypothetical protein